MHEATKAPQVSYFDYIIVGGGTAGCPLAATLSQNSSVLLLERGGSPFNNPNITNITAFGAALMDTSSTSPSQLFFSEDGVRNARGRVLGGGSSINAGFYSRASSAFIKDAGWDEKLVNESYRWVERAIVFKPVVRQWQSAMKAGLLEAGVTPYNGFTYDHLYGTKTGGTIFDKNGHRHSAAYLLRYASSSRLMLYLHATVHKILFMIKGNSRPMAHGVVFRDSLGKKHIAYLKHGSKNEILVSAGSLGSPQLLMLSGLGPKDQLQSHGIHVVLAQPGIGDGMADNPKAAIFVPSPTPVEFSIVEVVGITHSGNYIEGRSGSNLVSGQYKNVSLKMGGYIFEKILGPLSTGHLELKSLDPNDNPSVTFNYFKRPVDLQRCVNGLTTIIKTIKTKAFSKFRYPFLNTKDLLNITASLPQNLPVNSNTTSSLEQFCKDTVSTMWHYHGGCRVDEVVDHDYKVVGVEHLRVVDGSTFRTSPGTNPQATVMMLGRYMGVKILQERLLCNK
uniref:protein HOTHEAD-like n=1 Tax=Erigeron canadensis TaxID=72917 RepID=UPI001CB9BE9E|nr:protein HOTHEAD-like [Erigeron canadensis]